MLPWYAHGKVLTDVGGERCAVVHMTNRFLDVVQGRVTDVPYPNKVRNQHVPESDRLIIPRNGGTTYGIHQ